MKHSMKHRCVPIPDCRCNNHRVWVAHSQRLAIHSWVCGLAETCLGSTGGLSVHLALSGLHFLSWLAGDGSSQDEKQENQRGRGNMEAFR